MYILVLDTVPIGLAINSAAHAGAAAVLTWEYLDDDTPDPVFEEWLTSFKKVVCKVTQEEFEAARAYPEHILLTESALEGAPVALVFKPREEWPKAFKFYKLYR